MTEAEWLACDDPIPMLAFVRGRVSDRKLRLFACGCYRRAWHPPDDPSRAAVVEAAERFADGEAGLAAWAEAVSAELPLGPAGLPPHLFEQWAEAAPFVAIIAAGRRAAAAGTEAVGRAVAGRPPTMSRAVAAYFAARELRRDPRGSPFVALRIFCGSAALLRCTVGTPFRPAPAIDPAWLSWNGGTVPRLARAIYSDRAFDRLPILADALEDAGCTDAGLLAHSRSGGEHARGCWAVDLLLGKE